MTDLKNQKFASPTALPLPHFSYPRPRRRRRRRRRRQKYETKKPHTTSLDPR